MTIHFFLQPKSQSVLRLLFPGSIIDNKRALDLLQAELEKLEARTPHPILEGHKNLFGKMTSIEVPSAENNPAVQFMVYPDSPIEIFVTRSEITMPENLHLQTHVGDIAKTLAYDVEYIA